MSIIKHKLLKKKIFFSISMNLKTVIQDLGFENKWQSYQNLQSCCNEITLHHLSFILKSIMIVCI